MKVFLTTAAAVLLAFPVQAETTQLAQPACAPSITMLPKIMGTYGEQTIEEDHRPTVDGSQIVQWRLWANPATMTWTLTGTVGATSCVFAYGTDYHEVNLGLFLDEAA